MFFDDQEKKYIILDIEGNSAKQKSERRITQFSAILIHNGLHTEINMFNRNVNYINPYVVRLNNISVNSLKNNGMSERHMIEEIHNILEKCDVIYAYGYQFDKDILNYMFNKYKLSSLSNEWIDIQKYVSEKLHPSKLALPIVAKEYGFDKEDFHYALTDCHATLYLMEYMESLVEVK